MLEITESQFISSNYILSTSEGDQRADEILQYFDLPLNDRLEFYDQKGQLFSTYRYEDGSYAITDPISQDRSKKGCISLIWGSSTAINALAQAKPQLFDQIESRQELKPDRIPHPFDGAIHSIKITWQPGQTPHVEVLYVSGVQSADAPLSLDEGDIEYAGYLNVDRVLDFAAPEFECPGF